MYDYYRIRVNSNVVDVIMAADAVTAAIEALFFGSTWYFGILIFIILSLAIMRMWKYATGFIIPMIIALEVQYYTRLDEYGNFVWAMLSLLMLAIGMAIYAVLGKEKN